MAWYCEPLLTTATANAGVGGEGDARNVHIADSKGSPA
jgi:hypothetical protein